MSLERKKVSDAYSEDPIALPLQDTDIIFIIRPGQKPVGISYDDFKAEIGTGGSGGGGIVYTYQPGGTTDVSNNRYNDTDIDALVAALNSIAPQPRVLFVDNSADAGAPGDAIDIPAKSWRGDNLTIVSTFDDLSLAGVAIPQALNFLDGTLFTSGVPQFKDCTGIFNNTTQPVHESASGDLTVLAAELANLRNNGSQPFISAAAASALVFFGRRCDTNGGSGVLIDVAGASPTCLFIFEGNSQFDTDKFGTTNAALPLLQGLSSGVTLIGSYANWAGPTTNGIGKFSSRFTALASQIMYQAGVTVADALDSAGGGGSERTILFAPGQTTGTPPNLYADEADVAAALADVEGGPGTLMIDGTAAGNEAIFSNTSPQLNIWGWTVAGRKNVVTRQKLSWQSTAAANQPAIHRDIDVQFARSSGVVGNVAKVNTLDNATMQVVNTNAGQLDNRSDGSKFFLRNGSKILKGSLNEHLINVGPGSTIDLYIYDESEIDLEAFSIGVGATLNVYAEPGAKVNGNQVGSGTLTVRWMGSTSLGDNASGNVRKFHKRVTINPFASATPLTIIADADIPSGMRVYVEGFQLLVGGTTISGGTFTELVIGDNVAVQFATIPVAELIANRKLLPGVALDAGISSLADMDMEMSPGNAKSGLRVYSDGNAGAGSNLTLDIWGSIQ